ncbi:MAG: hypothetical protein ACRED5_19345 [Propylenella sp.]
MFEVVGWTIVLAFIATTIVTLLSLAGVIKLANRKYLDRLFVVLVIEIVAAGFFIFRTGFSPEQAYFREASALFEKAKLAEKEGKISEADVLFSKILQLPTDKLPFDIKAVFREQGHMAFKRKLWGRAAGAYSIYDEIGNDDIVVLVNYARSLRALNRYGDADAVYQRAERISPNNYDVLNGLQNVTRRLAAFYFEAGREDAAIPIFERARNYINSMISISEDGDKEQYQTALIARVRLNWQWERYAEAEAAARQLIDKFPDYTTAREDLAAILLEYGQKGALPGKLSLAKREYQDLYRALGKDSDDIFIGSGLAEAVAFATDATVDEFAEAENAVLLSIANAQKVEDDPYAFYAAAVLFHRQGKFAQAVEYLKSAIAAERRRSTNPYTFDYIRLVEYEKTLLRWTEVGNASSSGQ